jgi:hypothetical protein
MSQREEDPADFFTEVIEFTNDLTLLVPHGEDRRQHFSRILTQVTDKYGISTRRVARASLNMWLNGIPPVISVNALGGVNVTPDKQTNNTVSNSTLQNSVVGNENSGAWTNIKFFNDSVDGSTSEALDDEAKSALKRAMAAVDKLIATEDDRQDVKENLAKLTAEITKPAPDQTKLKRFFLRVWEVGKPVGEVLLTAGKLAAVFGAFAHHTPPHP